MDYWAPSAGETFKRCLTASRPGADCGLGSMGEVWFQEWQNGQPIVNTGANGLTLMDQAVQQAEAAGIKLVMCLTK